MSEALLHMVDALDLEVAAIRKQGGGIQIELRGGEHIGQAEDNWLYRFPVWEDLNLRDDTPVRLVYGDRETSGVLVSFRDGVLVVAVEADLGPKIAFAQLVADDSFLVERLKERLKKVRSGEAQFNKSSTERVIGEANIRAGDAEAEARGAERGLWRKEPYPVVEAAEADSRLGEVVTVRFRCVRSFERSRHRVLEAPGAVFEAVIPAAVLKTLPGSLDFKSRTVETTGLVELYKGRPQVMIGVPAQVKRVD